MIAAPCATALDVAPALRKAGQDAALASSTRPATSECADVRETRDIAAVVVVLSVTAGCWDDWLSRTGWW
jgi:hypothetical protein